jgi:hypothetical protein
LLIFFNAHRCNFQARTFLCSFSIKKTQNIFGL